MSRNKQAFTHLDKYGVSLTIFIGFIKFRFCNIIIVLLGVAADARKHGEIS